MKLNFLSIFCAIFCIYSIILVSGFLPSVNALHNENLYVSAENADFENIFGGAQ